MGFDETIRQLDHILQIERQRKEVSLGLLRSIVGRLDGGLLPPDELAEGERDERIGTRRRLTPAGEPFIPLPRRTTHGGRFGPAVRERLRAEALGRR